jgi:protein-tyrosine phosphatase
MPVKSWHGEIKSAGISALTNHVVDNKILTMMSCRGIVLDSHRAKQISRNNLYNADLVLVMDKQQRFDVIKIDPTVTGKIYLLGHWCDLEIPDPYGCCDATYKNILKLIDYCVKQWVSKITKQ